MKEPSMLPAAPGAMVSRKRAPAAARRRGETATIHCRGGLGRTGMLAAQILVEGGTKPQEAIDCVRGARPGSIETPEERRVRCARARPDLVRAEKVLGCLLGGAIGDAIGYPIEKDEHRAPEIVHDRCTEARVR